MEKKKNLLIIFLSIIVVLLLGMLVYLLFFNKKEELKPVDNPPINNNENKSDGPYANFLDYEKIKNDLVNNVISGKRIYLENCESCEGIDFDNYDEAVCHKKELTINSITTFINKLKKATKVEELPTSKACSLYSYWIEDSGLSAFEADDPSILLVGLNGKGYAYHFAGEDVKDFLKNLK